MNDSYHPPYINLTDFCDPILDERCCYKQI